MILLYLKNLVSLCYNMITNHSKLVFKNIYQRNLQRHNYEYWLSRSLYLFFNSIKILTFTFLITTFFLFWLLSTNKGFSYWNICTSYHMKVQSYLFKPVIWHFLWDLICTLLSSSCNGKQLRALSHFEQVFTCFNSVVWIYSWLNLKYI